MTSSNTKKQCTTCEKGAGVATCDGCQRSFCVKHFGEHRQELSQQIDNIGQEHDLLRRDIDEHIINKSLLARINSWEKESIVKIRVAAEAARADLEELLNRNRKELKKSITRITNELQACQESDAYTEIDINKWIQQLQALRKMLDSPSNISIDEDETSKSIIRLIRISDRQARPWKLAIDLFQHPVVAVRETNSSVNERFDDVIGTATISEEGLLVICFPNPSKFGPTIYGANLYSVGTHHIHFQIVKIGSSRMFFGITTVSARIKNVLDRDQSQYGWWDFARMVANWQVREYNEDNMFKTDDKVTLTLNCDDHQIQLQHHRTNQLVQQYVDINNCPFPWKIIVKISSNGDALRIIP